MSQGPEIGRQSDAIVPLLLLALFLLASPFTLLWAADTSPWYLPYMLWLALIGLIAWAHRRPRAP